MPISRSTSPIERLRAEGLRRRLLGVALPLREPLRVLDGVVGVELAGAPRGAAGIATVHRLDIGIATFGFRAAMVFGGDLAAEAVEGIGDEHLVVPLALGIDGRCAFLVVEPDDAPGVVFGVVAPPVGIASDLAQQHEFEGHGSLLSGPEVFGAWWRGFRAVVGGRATEHERAGFGAFAVFAAGEEESDRLGRVFALDGIKGFADALLAVAHPHLAQERAFAVAEKP